MTSQFLERLNNSSVLIADGATGTNLQARGLPRGMSSDVWVLERPDEIVALHREFLSAGSDLLLTCTFGATRPRLESAGLGSRSAEINQRAVELARQAVNDSQALVAGSIGPTGQLLEPLGPITTAAAEKAFREQAAALAGAGVDLLVIETQFDLAEASAAVRAARQVTTLPVVVSFSYDRGIRTMMGVRPSQMAQEMEALGVDMLGINCGRSLADNLKALQELAEATRLPIWFKPNAGLPRIEDDHAVYDMTPQEMGVGAADWVALGARVVGGCCGTSPAHLGEIAKAARTYA